MPEKLKSFKHPALQIEKDRKVVFAALSKHVFYFRTHIVKFVLEQGCAPINPFMSFDYFLLDSVPRDFVREANNSLLKKADELWVFGPISDGVLAEIKIAQTEQKPVRYFNIIDSMRIEEEKDVSKIIMEEEVKNYTV